MRKYETTLVVQGQADKHHQSHRFFVGWRRRKTCHAAATLSAVFRRHIICIVFGHDPGRPRACVVSARN